VSQTGCRTPLTYYGGKQRLARRIVALMPPHRVYLEPFTGGAAVLFRKPRAARETLNDLDSREHAVLARAARPPDELAAAIATTPYSREEWALCRARPDAVDDVEAARRFLVWIDQSFSREGTGWSPPPVRFDRRGRWQAGVWANLPDKLAAAADRLAGVALEHRPNRTSAPSPTRSRDARPREDEERSCGPRQPDARDWAIPSVRPSGRRRMHS
jgi:DNA adenine methylase